MNRAVVEQMLRQTNRAFYVVTKVKCPFFRLLERDVHSKNSGLNVAPVI
jgi:hypothetical protein